MQTIEQAPLKTIDENELEQVALSHPHPDTLPAPHASFSIWRVVFWAAVIFGAIVIGATILAIPRFAGC